MLTKHLYHIATNSTDPVAGCYISRASAGRSRRGLSPTRKVRAPQGRPPGNAWAPTVSATDSATENKPPA
jgi:hypothetical protein